MKFVKQFSLRFVTFVKDVRQLLQTTQSSHNLLHNPPTNRTIIAHSGAGAKRGSARGGEEDSVRRIQEERRVRTRSVSMSMMHEQFQAAPPRCCAVNLLWSVAGWVGVRSRAVRAVNTVTVTVY